MRRHRPSRKSGPGPWRAAVPVNPRARHTEFYLQGASGAGEHIPPPPNPPPPLLAHLESRAPIPAVGALRARACRPPARSNPRACRPRPRRRALTSVSGSARFRS